MAIHTDGPRKGFEAAADYRLKQYYIVWVGAGVATLADDADQPGENIMGALMNKPNIGETAEVQLPHGGGTGKVILGGTVAVGDQLTTDSAGKAIVTTTSDDYVFGLALQVGEAGDVIEYEPCFDIVD